MWILDRPPTGPKSPDPPPSIAAFTDFAVAAVRRYRQRGVIWELWNVRSLSHCTVLLGLVGLTRGVGGRQEPNLNYDSRDGACPFPSWRVWRLCYRCTASLCCALV